MGNNWISLIGVYFNKVGLHNSLLYLCFHSVLYTLMCPVLCPAAWSRTHLCVQDTITHCRTRPCVLLCPTGDWRTRWCVLYTLMCPAQFNVYCTHFLCAVHIYVSSHWQDTWMCTAHINVCSTHNTYFPLMLNLEVTGRVFGMQPPEERREGWRPSCTPCSFAFEFHCVFFCLWLPWVVSVHTTYL